MRVRKNYFLDASKKRREDRHRLTEFNIREVSVVDRAANQRPFLVIKQEDGMGNSATKPKADAKPTDDLHFGDDPAEVADLEKSQIIASPVKAAALAITTEAIERVMRVAKAIRAATIKDDTGARPLSLVLGRELRSVSGLLKSLTSQFPVAERDETDTEKKAKAKQQCPPNMVWDPAKDRCVFGKPKKKALTEDQKSTIDAQLADVIAKATALKETVAKADTTDADADAVLGDDFGNEIIALANRLGFISGVAPSRTAKSFAVVNLECETDAIEKAADALTLTTAQRDTLISEVEKSLDMLVETLHGVDAMREADVETGPLPDFVANACEQAVTDLLKVDAEYTVVKDEGDKGEDEEESDADADADADGDASDDGKDSKDGDSSEGDAAADAGDADKGGDADAGDGDADAGDANAGAADADAVAKAVQAGVEKALASQAVETAKREAKTNEVIEGLVASVAKLNGETPAPNGGQPGDDAPTKVTKNDGFDEPHMGDFTPEQIEKAKKDGEWF